MFNSWGCIKPGCLFKLSFNDDKTSFKVHEKDSEHSCDPKTHKIEENKGETKASIHFIVGFKNPVKFTYNMYV